MERLYPVGVLFLWAFLTIVAGVDARAAERYCSLAVTVSATTGARVEASVIVQEQNGQVTEKETEPGKGTAEFCDLGIIPVTVKVGDDGSCNQVVIKDVPLIWKETQRIAVTYQPDACPPDSPRLVPLKCALMIRVKDGIVAVPNATVKGPPDRSTQISDEYGRTLFYVPVGRLVDISVEAKGYMGSTVKAACPSGIDPSEKTVILRKQTDAK